MKLKESQMLDLRNVVTILSKIQGIVAILLFGSAARGDYNEYSDYDLLVLFEDKTLMWRNWDELFEAIGSLKMNLHVIPETLEELKAANPAFQNELFEHGKVLFARLPLEAFLQPVKLEPFCLISYDMGGLSHRDKMKAVYFLYRKGGVGTVVKKGGIKLGEGCLLVPSNASDEIIRVLRTLGVDTKKLEIYVSEEITRSIIKDANTATKKLPNSGLDFNE